VDLLLRGRGEWKERGRDRKRGGTRRGGMGRGMGVVHPLFPI